MSRLGALMLAGLAAAPAAAQPALVDPPLPLVTRVELAVRVDYDAERIAGRATLTLRNAAASPLSRVPLLLNRLMRVAATRDGGGRDLVRRQRVTTFEDMPKFQVNAIDVDLAEPLPAGGATRVVVAFEGYLVGYTEVGMRYVRDHVSRDFTILREDAYAFPVVGVPSMRANRASLRVPFDFDVSVTVPEELVVATGGELIGRTVSGGLATSRHRSREPAPYVIVAIARYRVAEAEGLRVFHFPEDSDGAQSVLQAARRAAARCREILGPLDRPLALNIMEIPEGWGSQASLAGGIIQEAGAFRTRDQWQALYHELSHLWNATDLDLPSPRWNEGLARFLQLRLARELDGWDGEAAALARTAARLLEQCGSDARCGRVPMRQYGREQLTDYSYLVGQLMFAALWHALGEDAFDRALRDHFQGHKASGTRTDDLVRVFVAAGGPASRRIFDDWLESTAWIGRLRGAPSLQAVFDSYRQ